MIKYTEEQLAQGDKMLAEFNSQKVVGGNIKEASIYHYGETSLFTLSAKNSDQDGMELLFNNYPDEHPNEYEVVEQMAGPNEDERWTYTRTKSLKVAMKSLMRGNKNRRIIEKF